MWSRGVTRAQERGDNGAALPEPSPAGPAGSSLLNCGTDRGGMSPHRPQTWRSIKALQGLPHPQPGTIIWGRQNLPPFPSSWDPQTMVSPGHSATRPPGAHGSISVPSGRTGRAEPGMCPRAVGQGRGAGGFPCTPRMIPNQTRSLPRGFAQSRGKECPGCPHPITQVDTRLGCPCHPGGGHTPREPRAGG